MLILTGAIDEDGLAVEVEAVVAILAEHRPRDVADAKWGAHLVGSLLVALDHRHQIVEIGVVETPAVGIGNGFSMTQLLAATRTQSDNLSMTEYLFATGQRKLVDQLEGLGMLGIVLHLRLDKTHGTKLNLIIFH